MLVIAIVGLIIGAVVFRVIAKELIKVMVISVHE